MTGIRLNITLPPGVLAQVRDAIAAAWVDGFCQGLAWGLLCGVVVLAGVLLVVTRRQTR